MPRVTLPIACAVDREYLLPLLVMLTSLKRHLSPAYEPLLYLIHRNLDEDTLAAVSRLVEFRSILLGGGNLARMPQHPHFPPEAATPLLLGDLLPASMERILFLDADLLVLDDCAKLWETPTQDRVLAAAPDSAIPFCGSPRGVKSPEERGIPRDARYFNCGVMLMDLTAWRKRAVASRALAYLQEPGGAADFLHQEALNAVLWNDWQPLDPRWNLLGGIAGRPFSRNAYERISEPGIVHFAGRFKPWRAPVGGPFGDLYAGMLAEVIPSAPAVRPTLQDKLLSLYDRHLRNTFYECERALWNRRLI